MIPDTAADEAAAWLLRVRSAPDDPTLRAELDDWLSRDERHVEAWDAARRMWSLAGIVGPASPRPAAAQGRPAGGPAHVKRGGTPVRLQAARGWGVGLAAAACLCLAIVLYPTLQIRVRADHVSATGETRRVELADGSTVDLDSSSAIAVDYTPGHRLVTLLAGQAFFSVRRDPDRPFSVDAGAIKVTVTGTEFDVRMASADVSVAVAHGEVRVTRPGDPRTGATVLAAGERLSVGRAGGEARLGSVSPGSVAPWRRGRLLIESATIGELVEELRRHRAGIIVITDKTLAAQRVTGVFDVRDPVRALKTVVEPHAGRVREITPWLVVVSGG